MDTTLILGATSMLGGAGLVLGLGLAYASKKFHVDIDERIETILDALPGTNCGACGFIGCEDAAGAIAAGKSGANTCIAGGHDVAEHIALIMGVEKGDVAAPKIAALQCAGGRKTVKKRYDFSLLDDCAAANMLAGGPSACNFGCLGYGTCIKACPFDAMYMGEDDLPKILIEKCTGCGNCNKVCPRGLLPLIDLEAPLFVVCKSLDKGKDVRGYCKAGCIACKICEKSCGEGSFSVVDNLAVVDYEKFKDCHKEQCIEKCPTKCIVANDGVNYANKKRSVKKVEKKEVGHCALE
jgi:Na+-translocating ferredoxin:NAD+ oxidoreductase RNF subunit RnfB